MAEAAAQAPRLPAGEASLIRFSVRIPAIVPLLLAGLVLRLALAFLPGFGVDIGTFTAWSNDLAANNPWNFYREGFFADYAPGYLHVLWFLGELNQQFHFTGDQFEYILKLPSIAADLGSAWLIYLVLAGERMRLRLGVVAAYLLFPPALLIGAIWGQVDSILSFFLLLSVYYIGNGHPVRGAVAYAVGFIVKIQAIAALPFLAFWILRDYINLRPAEGEPMVRNPKVLLMCIVAPLAALLVIITPFFGFRFWELFEVMEHATKTENYRVNSFWAYNFWNTGGLFDMGFRCDGSQCLGPQQARATYWLGIATRWWGLGMFIISIAAIIFTFRKARGTGFLALGTALSVLAFYLFMTRMHERYAFAAFLPFLVACALLHSRVLWATFIAAAAIHFLNLYHVYQYYFPNELLWQRGYDWLAHGDFLGTGLETIQVLSGALVVCFLVALAASYSLVLQRFRVEAPP